MPEPLLEPVGHALSPGRRKLVTVVNGEVPVGVPMRHEERDRRDGCRHLTWLLGYRVPAVHPDAGAQEPPGEGTTRRGFNQPVKSPHRGTASVIPAGGAAHGGHGIDAATQGCVTYDDRGTQREPEGHDALVTEGSRPHHSRVDVVNLEVAHSRDPAGSAVTSQVRDQDRAVRVQLGSDSLDCWLAPMPGEAVSDDVRQIRPTLREWWEVSGLDPDAVNGQQPTPLYDRVQRSILFTCAHHVRYPANVRIRVKQQSCCPPGPFVFQAP